MMQPKRRKYRKEFRGKRRGKASRGNVVSFGEYGLKSLGRDWVSAAQIEAGRRAITNNLKRKGKVWIRIFPDKPVTGRAAGQRMGSGKGEIDRYVVTVKPGRVIYEIAGVPEEVAREALRRAGDKLPIRTIIIERN